MYINLLDLRVKFRIWGLKTLPYDVCFFLFDIHATKRWFRFFLMYFSVFYLVTSNVQIVWYSNLNPIIFITIQLFFSLVQLFIAQMNLIRFFLNFIFGSINLYVCWSVCLVELCIVDSVDLYFLHIYSKDNLSLYYKDLYKLMYFIYDCGVLHYFIYNVFGSSKMMQVFSYLFLYFLIEYCVVGLFSIFILVCKGIHISFFNSPQLFIFSFFNMYCILIQNSFFLHMIFNFFTLYCIFLFGLQLFILYTFDFNTIDLLIS